MAFSGNWVQVYHGKDGSNTLVNTLGQVFASFGVPETITTDGGPQYMAKQKQQFLTKHGVTHRLTSVAFPHSNLKAERTVSIAKRLCRDAITSMGEFNHTSLTRGLLNLRNTPNPDIGLSPAELLLGRQLRDFLPSKPPKPHTSHTELADLWKKVADYRDLALAPHAARTHQELLKKTRELSPLKVGDHVMVQNQEGNHPKRWDKRGQVIECLRHRQYQVMNTARGGSPSGTESS